MRALHRWVSIVAALFLAIVAITGALLAMDEIALRLSGRLPKAYGGSIADAPAPLGTLQEQDLSRLLGNTLQGAQAAAPGARFTSVWLRVSGPMTQGIVTTGAPDARQLTFNAESGERILPDSPSLPPTGYVLRWDIHQWVKRIHRGDALGLTGRWMSVAVGVSLAILTVSAIWMYAQLWAQRRRLGRRGWFWR